MEKNGYTILQKARLLREQLGKLQDEIANKIRQTDQLLIKYSDDVAAETIYLAYPTVSDMVTLANRVGQTAAHLEALVWVRTNEELERPALIRSGAISAVSSKPIGSNSKE